MHTGRYCKDGLFRQVNKMTREEAIQVLRHIIQVADTSDCGVKEIDGIDEEALNMAITIIGSFEQIKWEHDTAIAQLKELGYEFGEKIRTDDDLISRQAVLNKIKEVCFSEEWIPFRVNNGSNGQRDLIIDYIKHLPPVTPQEPKILNTLDFAIDASNGDTNYFVGFRNGLRYAKSLIDSKEPQFESCTEQEPKTGHWIEHPEIETSTPEYLMFYECSECGGKQCFIKSDIHKKRFCSNCGCRMVEPQESEVEE